MNRLMDKVVVITGGSSGIGLACAKLFTDEGAKVVIFGHNKEGLKQAENKIERDILTVHGDVRKITDLEELYKQTNMKYGSVDIVIANAGIGESRHVSEVTEECFDKTMQVNFKGVYFTVQRAIPYLNKPASIILISSIAAHCVFSKHSIYSATKAAVSMLARNFSNDLISNEIRVNAISPGITETPIWDDAIKDDPELFERLAAEIPNKRIAQAVEVAETALFLASDQSSYIVGQDIVIDGGCVGAKTLLGE